MVQEHDIREQLSAFVAREISLASFERWLNASSQQMFRDDDVEAIKLIASINSLVSERHDQIISDAELREAFVSILNNIIVSRPVDLHQYRPMGHFAASSENLSVPVPLPVVA
jgi:hypothetical protein